MTQTIAETVANFPALLTRKAYRINDDIKPVLAAIDEAKAVVFDKPGKRFERLRSRQAKVLDALAKRFMLAKLSQHYPVLDDHLFKMKRYIAIQHNRGPRWSVETKIVADQRRDFDKKPAKTADRYNSMAYVECHLFAIAKINLDSDRQSAEMGFFQYDKNRHYINADMPGMLDHHILDHINRFKSRYYAALSECFSIPKIADVISTENDSHWQDREAPELEVIWIPTTESIFVSKHVVAQPEDPALVFNYHGKRLLLHMWNVENEMPFEHLIREFSLGPIPDDEEN